MSKLEEYERRRDFCRDKADVASTPEFRAVWRAVAESYQLLIGLESLKNDRSASNAHS